MTLNPRRVPRPTQQPNVSIARMAARRRSVRVDRVSDADCCLRRNASTRGPTRRRARLSEPAGCLARRDERELVAQPTGLDEPDDAAGHAVRRERSPTLNAQRRLGIASHRDAAGADCTTGRRCAGSKTANFPSDPALAKIDRRRDPGTANVLVIDLLYQTERAAAPPRHRPLSGP